MSRPSFERQATPHHGVIFLPKYFERAAERANTLIHAHQSSTERGARSKTYSIIGYFDDDFTITGIHFDKYGRRSRVSQDIGYSLLNDTIDRLRKRAIRRCSALDQCARRCGYSALEIAYSGVGSGCFVPIPAHVNRADGDPQGSCDLSAAALLRPATYPARAVQFCITARNRLKQYRAVGSNGKQQRSQLVMKFSRQVSGVHHPAATRSCTTASHCDRSSGSACSQVHWPPCNFFGSPEVL